MRARLMVIAVLFVGIIGIVVASKVFRHHAPSSTNACVEFIRDIETPDSDKAYALFSKQLQKNLSLDAWKKEVPGLNSAYGGLAYIAPTFVSQTSFAATKTNAAATRRVYTIENGNTYTITCTLVAENGGYAIDSFSSQQATDTSSGN